MKVYPVDICGFKTELPIMQLPSGLGIAFFNLHGDSELTEHCGKELAKLLTDCDVLITAESKGLQLTHCTARELGQRFYAVARKSKKLYMQDGIEVDIESSITTGKEQKLYLSKHDVDLIKGKKVGIVDDVVSTGASLKGLEAIVEKAGGIIHKKAFVLAEAEAAERTDVLFLASIPVFPPEKN
nr:adenine phosphoribosyltransferase [Clostridia bacterium]